MRRRLAALIGTFEDLRNELNWDVPEELGIDVIGNWPEFLSTCALRDVLDLITVAFRLLVKKDNVRRFSNRNWERWCSEVERIFREENVHYTVDGRGGVHFKYDAEFAHSRATTIAGLQGARYRNTLNEFEGGMAALAKAPPDGKAAIRATFAAAEGLFRLMFPNAPRLTAQEAQQKLEPVLQRLHAADAVATGSTSKLLNAFKDWIDAAHFYRHEAGHEEPTQPPLPLAVQMVSVGAAFIRWLGELDSSQPQSE